MTLHADVTMPPGLEDFPWKNLLHMWDYGLGHGTPMGTRLKLWYPMGEGCTTPQQYLASALVLHLEVWEWVAARYELVAVPELDSGGRAWMTLRYDSVAKLEAGDGVWRQHYDQLAIWGTFTLGRRSGEESDWVPKRRRLG